MQRRCQRGNRAGVPGFGQWDLANRVEYRMVKYLMRYFLPIIL